MKLEVWVNDDSCALFLDKHFLSECMDLKTAGESSFPMLLSTHFTPTLKMERVDWPCF